MERSQFGLRSLTDLSEHLRRRRLIEADRVVLRPTHHADCFEHPQHTQTCRVCGEFGLTERQGDKADRSQVVHLIRLRDLQRRDQRRQISQITRNQLDERHFFLQLRGSRVVLPLDHPVDVVAFPVKELSEMMAVLARDTCDESAWHKALQPTWQAFVNLPEQAARYHRCR